MDVSGAGAIVSGRASGLGEAATVRRLHEEMARTSSSPTSTPRRAGARLPSSASGPSSSRPTSPTRTRSWSPSTPSPHPTGCGSPSPARGSAGRSGSPASRDLPSISSATWSGQPDRRSTTVRLPPPAPNDNVPDEKGRSGRLRLDRIGRGLRRPDRPDRLLGLKGGIVGMSAYRRSRPLEPRDPRHGDCAGPLRHAASWLAALPDPPARRSARRSRHQAASADLEFAELVLDRDQPDAQRGDDPARRRSRCRRSSDRRPGALTVAALTSRPLPGSNRGDFRRIAGRNPSPARSSPSPGGPVTERQKKSTCG